MNLDQEKDGYIYPKIERFGKTRILSETNRRGAAAFYMYTGGDGRYGISGGALGRAETGGSGVKTLKSVSGPPLQIFEEVDVLPASDFEG